MDDTQKIAVEALNSAQSAHKRIDGIVKDVDAINILAQSVSAQTVEMKHLNNEVKEMKTDVKELKEAPRRRWDVIVNTIITAVVSALAGALLVLILK